MNPDHYRNWFAYVWIQRTIDVKLYAGPMPFACERIADSGFGWLMTTER